MTHQFRTKIKDISGICEASLIEAQNGHDYDSIDYTDLTLIYEVEFEVREWGIKSTNINVIGFSLSIEQDDFEHYNDFTDELTKSKGFNVELSEKDFKVEVCIDNLEFGSIALTEAYIDFEEWTIQFS